MARIGKDCMLQKRCGKAQVALGSKCRWLGDDLVGAFHVVDAALRRVDLVTIAPTQQQSNGATEGHVADKEGLHIDPTKRNAVSVHSATHPSLPPFRWRRH